MKSRSAPFPDPHRRRLIAALGSAGATATFGSDCSAMMYGYSTRSARRKCAIAMPVTVPARQPKTKPSSASPRVIPAW